MNGEIMNKLITFRNARNWEQYHTGENLAKSIAIEAAELLEIFQWEDNPDDLVHIKEELADILIYAFLFANRYQLDINQIIEEKIAKNALKYPVKKEE